MTGRMCDEVVCEVCVRVCEGCKEQAGSSGVKDPLQFSLLVIAVKVVVYCYEGVNVS